MQIRQVDNVVNAILDRLGIYRSGGEEVGVREVLDFVLGPNPTVLREPEPQVGLDTLI